MENILKIKNKSINVLDCTLRDGGSCNEWYFGKDNIKKITAGLVEANINIVECGFLTQNISEYDENRTKFNDINQISKFIPKNREEKIFVCMMNYGEYNVEELPNFDGKSVDGIRVAFHKKDAVNALDICKKIKEKGYKVFVQPMVSLNYTCEEFLKIIDICNTIEAYAFYIVDSFGIMKRKDLIRLYYIVENRLNTSIVIGYHGHNNMQMAYANAQTLLDICGKRNIILDSSIYGMGRGAGNLNTELLIEELNDNFETGYQLKPLLNIIDEIITDFKNCNNWGYSLQNYLSAKYNSHPNYASYLDNKKTLSIDDMNQIFAIMDGEKRNNFDKPYIEQLYEKYMSRGKLDETHLEELKRILKNHKILILAPGKSIEKEIRKIKDFIDKEKPIVISVNFEYTDIKSDYIFIGNARRYRQMDMEKKHKFIVTSNVECLDVFLRIDYMKLLNSIQNVKDNSGLMLIKWLSILGIKKVYLAGFDGYSSDISNNYFDDKLSWIIKVNILKDKNIGLHSALEEFGKKIDIEFVTTRMYI